MYGSKSPTAIYLEEGKALPATTTSYSKSYKFNARDYRDIVRVYANTDVSIADAKALTLQLEVSADDATFAPLTSVLYTHTAATTADAWDAGELIGEQVVPENFVTNGYYVRVAITTTADESTEKIDIVVDAI